MTYRRIHMEDYRYDLPDSFIARYPLPKRSSSKLLSYRQGSLAQHSFRELPELMPEGSGLVFNTTRVIRARMMFRKPTGAKIEIFCLEPVDPSDLQMAFQARGKATFSCLVGNAGKWKGGPVILETSSGSGTLRVEATKVGAGESVFQIKFEWEPSDLPFGQVLEASGSMPLPPYLGREPEASDQTRYQTVYSQEPGSVAAPTAGLHFSHGLIGRLQKRKIRMLKLTLHVGAGTFVPVKEADPRHHTMHAETIVVSRAFLEEWLAGPERLIAVGTTSSRSMESLYWLGMKFMSGYHAEPEELELGQWEYERLPQDGSLAGSLEILLGYLRKHHLDQLVFPTQLMIVPGYKFRTLSGLITNFHLPGSSLLLLIAAFIGDDWKRVYSYALENHFRFLSYGDSSILFP